MTGLIQLGMMCLKMIFIRPVPMVSAAWTNLRSLTEMACPRMSRVYQGHQDRAGEDCVVQAAAHDGHHGDGEEQGREAEEHVGDTHDEVIHPAAEAAGDGTQGNADDKRQTNGGQCRGQGHPGAVDYPAENIPTQLVRAHQVLQTGSLELDLGVSGIG